MSDGDGCFMGLFVFCGEPASGRCLPLTPALSPAPSFASPFAKATGDQGKATEDASGGEGETPPAGERTLLETVEAALRGVGVVDAAALVPGLARVMEAMAAPGEMERDALRALGGELPAQGLAAWQVELAQRERELELALLGV